ncbi:hypothetical protein RDI58_027810 [Solanum bulbocastanum]|uniref:Uncharacterized protein n=1 Tax=Solanum bulbocastanum TaxID=147425 RepID=A0AAN8SZH2_SOLBU
MPELEKWCVLGKGEFPALQGLSIKDCPKLIQKFPETPFFELKEFEIVGSNAEVFTSQLQGMKQIVKLVVTDCHSLTSLPISILPSTLKRIHIYRCEKLKLEAPVSEMISNIFLEILHLRGCDSIDDISPELVPRALSLIGSSCCNLTRLLIPTGTENLFISDWLSIYHDGSDEEILADKNWELPCTIRSLAISNLKTLSSQFLKSLTSLKSLYAVNLPQIQSLLEEGLPSSLSELYLYDLHDLHSPSTQGLCTSHGFNV